MNIRKAILWIVFLGFSAYTGYVMLEVGYIGIFAGGMANLGSTQVLIDLVIACVIILTWMRRDAVERGVNPYPWFLVVGATGSIGILIYLLIREYSKANVSARTATAA